MSGTPRCCQEVRDAKCRKSPSSLILAAQLPVRLPITQAQATTTSLPPSPHFARTIRSRSVAGSIVAEGGWALSLPPFRSSPGSTGRPQPHGSRSVGSPYFGERSLDDHYAESFRMMLMPAALMSDATSAGEAFRIFTNISRRI